MDLARRSRLSRNNKNVGLNMQKRILPMEKVELKGLEEGWVKAEGSAVANCHADLSALEDEVAKELGWI